MQAERAASQVLDVWISHGNRDRVIVPNQNDNTFGSSYHLRETECQASRQDLPTLVSSMGTWQQRKLWASVSPQAVLLKLAQVLLSSAKGPVQQLQATQMPDCVPKVWGHEKLGLRSRESNPGLMGESHMS